MANLLLATVFDFMVQWILSMALALALANILTPFTVFRNLCNFLFAFIFGPFFRSAHAMLLVVLWALRYIV